MLVSGKAAAVVGALLTLSVAVNGLLAWAYLGQRDAATLAEEAAQDMSGQRDGAREAARLCSASVERARLAADDAARRAQAAQDAARAAARRLQQRADAVLAAPPAVPGDDCASARVRVDAWLRERQAP